MRRIHLYYELPGLQVCLTDGPIKLAARIPHRLIAGAALLPPRWGRSDPLQSSYSPCALAHRWTFRNQDASLHSASDGGVWSIISHAAPSGLSRLHVTEMVLRLPGSCAPERQFAAQENGSTTPERAFAEKRHRW